MISNEPWTDFSAKSAIPAQPDYKLHIHFNDGADRTADFKPFLSQSQHPGIRVFLQPEKFQGFCVAHGDLIWGDHDLCFPVADL